MRIADFRFQISDLGPRRCGRNAPTTNLKSEIINHNSPRGFTLVELLMTITIIGILAGVVMGFMQYARQAAYEAKTKATIAKLNHVIMQRYESYMTRRVPVSTAGLTPRQAAEVRLAAIRYLMCFEMPERFNDVNPNAATSPPIDLPYGRKLPWPSLAIMYGQRFTARPPTTDFIHAKMLYMIVASNPEDLEQFSQNEIRTESDGYPVFIDGWGKPIYFLRWAPAFSSGITTSVSVGGSPVQISGPSTIQSGLPTKDHDPFDPRQVDSNAFHLIPLIYSAGRDRYYSIDTRQDVHLVSQPPKPNEDWKIFDRTDYMAVGAPCTAVDEGGSGLCYSDNIHNHSIEQR